MLSKHATEIVPSSLLLMIRRLPMCRCHCHSVRLLKRCNSTVTTNASAVIANKMRGIIKDQVLEEATKSDSRFWRGEQQAVKINGEHNTREVEHHHNTTIDGVHPHLLTSCIDDPICLSLEDPLVEWNLSQKPQRSMYVLPDGVTPDVDPFLLSKEDIKKVTEGIRNDLIGTDHPVLNKAAAYFFEEEGGASGKKVRPVMVMLLSKAMVVSNNDTCCQNILDSQRRLAQISEMIHTASLFHDDVIDNADTRRGKPTVHKLFGDKMAILAGDYLLARASIYLARLRNIHVVETMSTIIEHLVRGEVMQMKPPTSQQMEYYLRKNFYKTASLMANSCKSAAILGNQPDPVVHAAYRYGKHLGLAFQLVDDVLDFEGDATSLGKPALSDLNSGMATAPVLFAAQLYPEELHHLIQRKFKETGDIDLAMSFISKSDGINQTKHLAHVHVELAIDAAMELKESLYRDALVHLAYKIVNRTR